MKYTKNPPEGCNSPEKEGSNNSSHLRAGSASTSTRAGNHHQEPPSALPPSNHKMTTEQTREQALAEALGFLNIVHRNSDFVAIGHKSNRGVRAYYFDSIEAAAQEAIQLSEDPNTNAVWFAPNKIELIPGDTPDTYFLGKVTPSGEIEAEKERKGKPASITLGEATHITPGNHNFSRRQILSIDIDRKGDTKQPASSQELQEALGLASRVQSFFRVKGWPDGILAISGNGARIWYAIDEPAGSSLVKSILQFVKQEYANESFDIDTKLSNVATWDKLPGTMARKGEEVPEEGRVYRRAQVVEMPGEFLRVTTTQLEDVAALCNINFSPAKAIAAGRPKLAQSASWRFAFDIAGDLKHYIENDLGVKVYSVDESGGDTCINLEVCPGDTGNGKHKPGECSVIWKGGDHFPKVTCYHKSCAFSSATWKQLHEAIRPGSTLPRSRTGDGMPANPASVTVEANEVKAPKLDAITRDGFNDEFVEELQLLIEKKAFTDFMVRLSHALQHVPSAGLDVYTKAAKGHFGDALNINTLKNQIKRRRREAREEQQLEKLKALGLPLIFTTGRDSSQVIDEAIKAVKQKNNPPELFRRDEELAKVVEDDEGRPAIAFAKFQDLDELVHRSATFVRNGEHGVAASDMPTRHVSRIPYTKNQPFPVLRGIVESPVFRKNGTLISAPGYDEETGIYFRPDPGFKMPAIPEKPTEGQIKKAVSYLDDLFQDFKFVGVSKANYYGLLLTPIVRELYEGVTPMAGIDAPEKGSGKTLLTQLLSIITIGRQVETMNAPETAEEWRKNISANLAMGSRIIVVDNIKGRLSSGPLEMALTSPTVSDRRLGESKIMTLSNRSTWIATGNNLTPYGDMVRRVYIIKINTDIANPHLRDTKKFAHPRIVQHVLQNRGKYLGALLTMCRGWINAGMKAGKATLGSFEQWAGTVGGILEHAGVGGFLDNIVQTQVDGNSQNQELYELLELLHKLYRDEEFTAKQLAERMVEAYRADKAQQSGRWADNPMGYQGPCKDTIQLYGMMKKNVRTPIREGATQDAGRALGNALKYLKERWTGYDGVEYCLIREAPSGKKAVWWSVDKRINT